MSSQTATERTGLCCVGHGTQMLVPLKRHVWGINQMMGMNDGYGCTQARLSRACEDDKQKTRCHIVNPCCHSGKTYDVKDTCLLNRQSSFSIHPGFGFVFMSRPIKMVPNVLLVGDHQYSCK